MLIATSHASADAFLQQAQNALLEQETTTSLILGISQRVREHPERVKIQPFFFTVNSNAARLELAAIMTPPHNLILHCADSCDPAALNLLAEELTAEGWNVPGVIGAMPASEQFAHVWARHTGRTAHLNMRERAYELRAVIPPRPSDGRLHLAGPADLPLLAEWTRAFSLEALGEDMKIDEAREATGTRIDDRLLYVWDTGEPVSMAAVARPTLHGITVNLVYTPPEQRGRGYASNCVAAVSLRMLDGGYQFCTLFTNLANPTSNDIYQQIGYRPIADFNEYRFENH